MSPRIAPPPRRKRLSRPAAGGAQQALTEAMTDRLTWRAGFGPTDATRRSLKGLTLHAAVDRLMAAPQGPPRGPAPVRPDGSPLKPLESDMDMVLSWCDRMIRTGNPLVERLTFFWHRHFAPRRRPACEGDGPPLVPAHGRARDGLGVRGEPHRLDARSRRRWPRAPARATSWW